MKKKQNNQKSTMSMVLLGFSILMAQTGTFSVQAMDHKKIEGGSNDSILKADNKPLTTEQKIGQMRNTLALDLRAFNVDQDDFIRMLGVRVLSLKDAKGKDQEQLFENFRQILEKRNGAYKMDKFDDLGDKAVGTMYDAFKTTFVEEFKKGIVELAAVTIGEEKKILDEKIKEMSKHFTPIIEQLDKYLGGNKEDEAKKYFLAQLPALGKLFQELAASQEIKTNHALFTTLVCQAIQKPGAEKLVLAYNNIFTTVKRVQEVGEAGEAGKAGKVVTAEDAAVAQQLESIMKKLTAPSQDSQGQDLQLKPEAQLVANQSSSAPETKPNLSKPQQSSVSTELANKLAAQQTDQAPVDKVSVEDFDNLARAMQAVNQKQRKAMGEAPPTIQERKKSATETLASLQTIEDLLGTDQQEKIKPILGQYKEFLAAQTQDTTETETEKFLKQWFEPENASSQLKSDSAAGASGGSASSGGGSASGGSTSSGGSTRTKNPRGRKGRRGKGRRRGSQKVRRKIIRKKKKGSKK